VGLKYRMSLTEQEKSYIVEQVLQILRSPNKDEQLQALRDKVISDHPEGDRQELDTAVYSVIQAIEELYGNPPPK
jgi:hypothetical protein